MVIKTLKSFEEDSEDEIKILPLYRDPEDETDFVKALFRKTISMNGENEALIEELTKNWDLDRIAKMDIILMKMAITELQIFSNIPKKVTLKDSIISGHVQKGIMYEERIKNEQLKFDAQGLWVKDLQKQNKKLKVKLTFTKITLGGVIGGLTYLYFIK